MKSKQKTNISKLNLILVGTLLAAPFEPQAQAEHYRDYWRTGPTHQEEAVALKICLLADDLAYYKALHEASLLGNVVPQWVKNLRVGDPVLIGNGFFIALAGSGEGMMIEHAGPVGALVSIGLGTAASAQERDRIRKKVLPDYYFTDPMLQENRADYSVPIPLSGRSLDREHLLVMVLQNHEIYDALIERIDDSHLEFVSETAKGEIKDELRIHELQALGSVCPLLKSL